MSVQSFVTEVRRIVGSTGMTQRQLAGRLHVSPAQANRYLGGRAKISSQQLDKIFDLGQVVPEERARIRRLWQQACAAGIEVFSAGSPSAEDGRPVDAGDPLGESDATVTAPAPAPATLMDTGVEVLAPDLPGGKAAGADVGRPGATRGAEEPPSNRGGPMRWPRWLLGSAVCVLGVGGLVLAGYLTGNAPKAEARPTVATGGTVPGTPSPTATWGAGSAAVPARPACSVWQYRVTRHADMVNEKKMPFATAAEGQDFYRSFDASVPEVRYRYYGTLGVGGPAGYVLQEKLEFVREICGAQ
ncbi:hypothetical protein FRACA_840017 [Frankia canadensis]|uniref:HTH cro/C1-type domain-containing protein n=1 Tax=Frankia canadensis TaxID=1836972 RepID=A0A2I2L1U5_9ACTN|nr:hypothetical protein FRACA_840017 [Frankia canadensis]SOU59169.1 hypothetical protein FRACA_840017 [Frankia canadensis]